VHKNVIAKTNGSVVLTVDYVYDESNQLINRIRSLTILNYGIKREAMHYQNSCDIYLDLIL
jgi:hypothetical protein